MKAILFLLLLSCGAAFGQQVKSQSPVVPGQGSPVAAPTSLPLERFRLGETPAQCVARYGNPLQTYREVGMGKARFRKNGFELMITFLDGLAECIEYQKLDKEHKTFSQEEIKVLLSINGENWKLNENKEMFVTNWIAWDGATQRAFACNVLFANVFSVESFKFKTAEAAAREGAAKIAEQSKRAAQESAESAAKNRLKGL